MKKLLIPAAVAATMVSGSAMAEMSVKSYGFIKAAYLMSKDVDASYKPTAADETNVNSELDGKSLSQLHMSDSRFGFKANNGSKTSATIEFDFNGAAKNDPGTSDGTTLRHRQAFLGYKTANGEFKMGKMWSQFAALSPHTYQVTTINLGAGNTGFIVDALNYKHNFGKKMALGFETTTSGNDDASMSSGPNIGLRFDYKLGKGLVGLAYKSGTNSGKDITAGHTEDVSYNAMKLFYHGNYGSTDVKVEYYTAVNGGGVAGTIGGTANAAHTGGDDTKETGYWLSVKHAFGDTSVFGGISSAKVDNADDVGTREENGITRIGFDHKLDKDVLAFIDHSMFATTENGAEEVKGTQTQIGMMYKF